MRGEGFAGDEGQVGDCEEAGGGVGHGACEAWKGAVDAHIMSLLGRGDFRWKTRWRLAGWRGIRACGAFVTLGCDWCGVCIWELGEKHGDGVSLGRYCSPRVKFESSYVGDRVDTVSTRGGEVLISTCYFK